jgi:hypothetical protein
MKIKVKAFKDLKDFFAACFPDVEWTQEDVDNMGIGGVDEDGNESEFDVEAIKEIGCYGMAFPAHSTIYLWLTEKASLPLVFEMVGHEIAHVFLHNSMEAGDEVSVPNTASDWSTALISKLQELEDFVGAEEAACMLSEITRQTVIAVIDGFQQVGIRQLDIADLKLLED